MSRNVDLVTYDSFRTDHGGFVGYDRNTKPDLDRVAANGIVCENAKGGVPTISSMTAVVTGEHGWYGHQPYLTEPLTHVPLVISGVDDAGTVATPVELRELAPTIADIAGVGHRFSGRSLLPGTEPDPSAVSKVFADGGRRLVVHAPDVRYHQHDDARAVGRAEHDSLPPDDLRHPLASIASRHVASESEKRLIREQAGELKTERGV